MQSDEIHAMRLYERLLFDRIRKMRSERAQIIKKLRRAIRDRKKQTGGSNESDTT